ncbi:hypothetical protein BCR44DRAFT_41805, partial [Catenaria anguillulae PL171]
NPSTRAAINDPIHDTLLGRTLTVSRLAGLITSGPSALLTLIVINSILIRYDRRPLQRAVLLGSFISLANDVLIMVTMGKWLVDHDETYWTPCIILIHGLKRLHSIPTVHLVFLRSAALVRQFQGYQRFAKWFTLTYALLALVAIFLHVYAYYLGDWISHEARKSLVFRVGYRGINVFITLYYSLVAIGTDVYFFATHRLTPTMRRRLNTIRVFYDPMFYCALEVVLVCAVGTPLILNFVERTMDWTSPTYTEQLLLSVVAINSVFSVKAATLLPGETADELESDEGGESFGMSSKSGGGGRSGAQVSRACSSRGVSAIGTELYASAGPSSSTAPNNAVRAFVNKIPESFAPSSGIAAASQGGNQCGGGGGMSRGGTASSETTLLSSGQTWEHRNLV